GMNYRHIGKLMIEIKDEYIKNILLIEMISRTMKKIIHNENRNEMKNLLVPAQSPFMQIIVNIFNQIIKKDNMIWDNIKNELHIKYDIPIESINQIQQNIDIIKLIQVKIIILFFKFFFSFNLFFFS